MAFNWLEFLQTRRIPFVERGPNVARGNVNIHCPFCGIADPSEHMGLSLTTGFWGCWRNDRHRGRRPQKLIMELIHCGRAEADRIAGVNIPVVVEDDELLKRIKRFKADQETPSGKDDVSYLRVLPEMFKIERNVLSQPFLNYLAKRGYTFSEVISLCNTYELYGCLQGPFRYRLIVPVYSPTGLVNWTGRAIGDGVIPRYRTLSADPTKARKDNLPIAPVSIERAVWNWEELADTSGDTLVVCEGPFDAIRVDWLGKPIIRATCLFGKNLYEDQVMILEQLAERFHRCILLLDEDAKASALKHSDRLEFAGFEVCFLPSGIKDPAELHDSSELALILR